MTDQPASALVRDLKLRGLLDSTLVICAGEIGRTAMAEIRRPGDADTAGGATILTASTCGSPAAASKAAR